MDDIKPANCHIGRYNEQDMEVIAFMRLRHLHITWRTRQYFSRSAGFPVEAQGLVGSCSHKQLVPVNHISTCV